MRPVGLFYLTHVRFGGFASFTAHLYRALLLRGWAPFLYKVGARSEDRPRSFGNGIGYRNVSLAEALDLARASPAIITCAYWKKQETAIRALLGVGASIVLHDPTEFAPGMIGLLREKRSRVVAIRRRGQEALSAIGVESTFIPHPYVRAPVEAVERSTHAIALSRVDWDKHTEIIAGANRLLEPERRVRIFGEINRMYSHHKLDSAFPEWEAEYAGRFPLDWGAAARLARSARFVVDMSAISGDGDGTQYTFLEAWDAGAALVVSDRWIARGGEAVRPGETAFVAGGAEELAAILSDEDPERVTRRGERILEQHAPETIVPRYEEAGVLAAGRSKGAAEQPSRGSDPSVE